MEYAFREIEEKWQKRWKEERIYQVSNDSDKPKCYVLDMFPYPSGAGLHVGHPLGYIASDIYARYKRLQGFNVLHPMGFDAFGLPAEQYAIETGQHPAVTTEKNIEAFKKQMDNIGFCFDWSREVRTSDPRYYRWTQWIFLELFHSWYNREASKAEPISTLVNIFETQGNQAHPCPGEASLRFSSGEWLAFGENKRQKILMNYRLCYCGIGEVNWCEALGTVLANDEVVNGVSERGGYPVVKKKLRQWYLRITEYADRLLEGLGTVDFSEAMKEMQSNWIGRSSGADIEFKIKKPGSADALPLTVYTTRPDTVFGVDFMVLAPEHALVSEIKSPGQAAAVEDYVAYVQSRSERERIAEKKISGCFTGAYAIHPFSGKQIPVWISEYVLAGYGTGAIMAVPCGDERDHKFARHFNIPITNIIGDAYNGHEANPSKDVRLQNSDFLNGLPMAEAIEVVIRKLETEGTGLRKVNYKMRDAAFSRQRYWGEPFPIRWEEGIAYPLNEDRLPLELPYVETYKPGPEGEGPLANIPEWTAQHLETNTMPGYAGSSWYFLRYMDPGNDQVFASRKATDYWNQVDMYIGGTEHAVGHLLYSRMWTKVLSDLGYIGFDEPYKKLVNQGMIQGSSRFVYAFNFKLQPEIPVTFDHPVFVSFDVCRKYENDDPGLFKFILSRIGELSGLDPEKDFSTIGVIPLHVDIGLVSGNELDKEAFRRSNPKYAGAVFVSETDQYICGSEVEKMSKSKYNVVNPDDIVSRYGADTFRMYEMFLGPLEQSKPWDTKGIEGVHRFLKKLWRLFFPDGSLVVNDDAPTEGELRILHKTIKKVKEDTEKLSFNTAVSQFMICVNELTALKCHKKKVLEPLLILLTPYAPHVTEELWHLLKGAGSVLNASYPGYAEKYLQEATFTYPVAINGKTRTEMTFSADALQTDMEAEVLADNVVQKWIDGKQVKKMIVVKGRMINVVV
ncbi:MAG TPA: class I tRNA ligase family protein [Chitinophagaceae bacterium]|nr:class I tRNA ligase family protein [Chitinophagaceae bacterium]